MMQDTPTFYTDCAAVYTSGNTQSGVYTLTIPNTTMEVKVSLTDYSKFLLKNKTKQNKKASHWFIKIHSAWAMDFHKTNLFFVKKTLYATRFTVKKVWLKERWFNENVLNFQR